MKTLLLAFLLLIAAPLRADDLHDILTTLAISPLVRADFHQEKKLPALSKPLLSSGQLVFASREGVLLRIRQPVWAEIVITPDTLLQKTARTQTRLRLDQSPYGAMASLFGQLMQGDTEKLQANFAVIAVEKKAGHWALQLQPRDGHLQKLFTSLILHGDNFLREVQINEVGGGETRMTLSNPRTLPASLDDDEQHLFALAH